MDKLNGFRKYPRKNPPKRPVATRILDYQEVYLPLPIKQVVEQATRCMDCGIPFCHAGCPLGNIIPDFNHLVYQERWQEAGYPLPAF